MARLGVALANGDADEMTAWVDRHTTGTGASLVSAMFAIAGYTAGPIYLAAQRRHGRALRRNQAMFAVSPAAASAPDPIVRDAARFEMMILNGDPHGAVGVANSWMASPHDFAQFLSELTWRAHVAITTRMEFER
jgi:hypothetical protein